MTDAQSHPTLNMSAVVQATGVQPDTLRAWERRYGLPEPGRSEGGHRLYSRRDVEIVKWLRDRQEEGLRISQAVELWQTLQSEGRDPLHMPRFATGETPLAQVDVAPSMAISRPQGRMGDRLRGVRRGSGREHPGPGIRRVPAGGGLRPPAGARPGRDRRGLVSQSTVRPARALRIRTCRSPVGGAVERSPAAHTPKPDHGRLPSQRTPSLRPADAHLPAEAAPAGRHSTWAKMSHWTGSRPHWFRPGRA